MNSWLWKVLPPRARSAWTTFRHYRRERRDFADFRRFYEQLPDQRDIFFLFFTERLLHWAVKALQFVPPEVNVVVVGSNLTREEAEWIRSHIDRPFHHVAVRIDDKTFWEFLFKVARHNFGWLDIDCFVANPRLFEEMKQIDDGVSLNSIWSYTGSGGHDVLCTHFLFLNVATLRAIEAQGVAVTPCTCNYEGSNIGRGSFSFSKAPTRRQVALLRQVLPPGDRGLPAYPSDVPARFNIKCFDTLILYQFVAQALGYRLHKVRSLSGTPETPGSFSPEVLHVNAASNYLILKDLDGIFQEHYRRMLQLDYFLLSDTLETSPDFPSHYRSRREEIAAELSRLGIPLRQVPLTAHRYLEQRFGACLAEHPAWAFIRDWYRREQDREVESPLAAAAPPAQGTRP